MIVAQSHGFEALQRAQLISCDSGWETGCFWGAVRGAGMFSRDLQGATWVYVLITVHRAVHFAVGKLFLVCVSATAVVNSVNLGLSKNRTDSLSVLQAIARCQGCAPSESSALFWRLLAVLALWSHPSHLCSFPSVCHTSLCLPAGTQVL